jgi:hypothetical protein
MLSLDAIYFGGIVYMPVHEVETPSIGPAFDRALAI